MSLYNTSPYKHLQRVLYCPCSYTTNAAKQRTGLYMGVSVNSPYSSAHNTAVTQTAYTPPAPRWRAYRQAQHLPQYQIQPPRRTLYRSAQPPYYNKVYKGAAVRPVMDPYQAVQHIADRASPAASRCFSRPAVCGLALGQRSERTGWCPPPGGQPSGRGRGRAEPLAATAVSLFGLSPDS